MTAHPMRPGRLVLGAAFVSAGVAHFAAPQVFLAMMPPWLPAHGPLVALSGVAEIAGGLGVLVDRTRRGAGWGLIVLLVAVFPANLQMLLNAIAASASGGSVTALVARLPLQPLLIWWVWRVTVRESPPREPRAGATT